jgi:membrane-associated phospholipid phosphatase
MCDCDNRRGACDCRPIKCGKGSCVNRTFQFQSNELRCLLGELEYKKCKCPPKENEQEIRYKNYHYNGSFHKGLTHDPSTGELLNNIDYENMRKGIMTNNQNLLNSVPLNPGATVKLADPLASLATALVGRQGCSLKLPPPPTLSSDAAAANMVEDYSMCMARDVPFINYDTDPIIATLLDTNHMNAPNVLANLQYTLPGPFTTKTIFTADCVSERIGPYVSQFMLLNSAFGGAIVPQKYISLISRAQATSMGLRVEWGVNQQEMIKIQNGLIQLLPPESPLVLQNTYIYNGRAGSEAVHADSAFQFFYQTAFLLTELGAPFNPGWPVFANQGPYITGPALPNVLCSMAGGTQEALLDVWYWKFQVWRVLRPECFSLWVTNILQGIVPNSPNYDISNVVLQNGVMADIFSLYGSYTLPQCYREGAPLHGSFPAGHGIYSACCATILKIFYNGNTLWNSLSGVISGVLSDGISGPIQANADGSTLVAYTGADSSAMTVGSELDKLAYNISLFRDWAGVHFKSDVISGIHLGEQVAISFMEDQLSATVENNPDGSTYGNPPQITFTKFNSEKYTLQPTICKRKKECC